MNALSLRPCRLCRPSILARRALLPSLSPPIRLSHSSQAVKTDRTPAKTPSYVHPSRTAPKNHNYKYPERLLVFHAPASTTAYIGTAKVAAITAFGFGCLILTPAAYFDDDTPLWLAATYLVCSAIPMVVTSFMTSPFVASIFVRLPSRARASKEALIAWARRMPQDTALEIQKIGFLPFPRTRALQLSELRTMRSKAVLANLEHVPRSRVAKQTPAWKRLAHYYLYARPTSSHWRKTPVPEMWPIVFEHAERNAIAAGVPGASVKDPTMPNSAPGQLQRQSPMPGKDGLHVSIMRDARKTGSSDRKRI